MTNYVSSNLFPAVDINLYNIEFCILKLLPYMILTRKVDIYVVNIAVFISFFLKKNNVTFGGQ